MRIVFAGTPDVAVPSLDALVQSSHEVVGVVTRPDAPAGRGRKLTPSPVAARAEELELPVLKPVHPRDEEFQTALRALEPDACAVVAYGALLPQSALDIPAEGWINLHFSVLPRWRGAAPVQRAVMAGDNETGTTCFRIVPALDAGPIFDVERHPMPEATAGELLAQLADSGAAQLVRVMDAIAQGAKPEEQPSDGTTVASKLTVDEARIDFHRPAEDVRNHVLGCSPDPGAWCMDGDARLKIFRARLAPDVEAEPGTLVVTKRQAFVGCGEGAVELLEVQASGKRRMAAIDWARGKGQGELR
uniref:methionyl-tRNA formyltransferase n=1 Tax=Tessaracoccus timonensis TaxID=2161816 RepID=UPI000D561448|nr:methionyl-tRNA formyltransferase [Tessaracoccus timonensis]